MVGDKEAQARAMREARFGRKPLELVRPSVPSVSGVTRGADLPPKRQPLEDRSGISAASPDEIRQALAFYRKHRERSKEGMKAWRKRKKGEA